MNTHTAHASMSMKTFFLLALATLLAACAETPPEARVYPEAAYGPPPANWQKVTMAYFNARLKDPYSAHIQVEGPPSKIPVRTIGGWGNTVPGYVVYVDVNAKNSFGGYTGEERIPVYFVNGELYYALCNGCF